MSKSDAGDRRVGLARALSKMGLCSRSAAFGLIQAGKVRLNGAAVRNPEAPVRLGKDRIEVDRDRLVREKPIYWMLNKPRGAVTTAKDEKGRKTVYAFLPAGLPWMAPVGRLDQASEGLLLFTNDSEWAARVTSPESHLDKIYHVQIDRLVDESLMRSLMAGVKVEDGEMLRAKSAAPLRAGEKNSWIEIVLDEGKNRQIRRMLESLGIEVLRLLRVRIGAVNLARLKKGEARELTHEEKASLSFSPGKE